MEAIKGKHILVVGATGTIGKKVVSLLAGSGATVYASGRDGKKLSNLTENSGIPQERTWVTDITNEDEVRAMAEDIHRTTPAVDVLINTAGIGIIKPLEDVTSQEFVTSMTCNLVGSFHLMKVFLPAMKARKAGLVINVPGVLGKVPMAGASAYAASKYGLVGMMQSLREEIRRTNIRITNLYLGGTDTAFWDTIDLRVQRDKMVTADEAARAIWFLCQQPHSGVVSEMVLQPFNHQAI